MGDLSASITQEYRGDLQVLRNAVNNTARQLRDTLGVIKRSSRTLAASAEGLTSTSGAMSGNAAIMTGQAHTAAATEQASTNVKHMAAGVEQISANASMSAIATTSDRMTASVTAVATAIEEMSASLNEVSKHSGQAATIEAASAGEAGEGFGLVANEVKELPTQTAAATEGIRVQVEDMQGNTLQAVQAIGEITSIIGEINLISTTIANAVEEQTATTHEIARSVGEAARGAGDVTRNVNQAAKGAKGGAAAEAKAMVARDLVPLTGEVIQLLQEVMG